MTVYSPRQYQRAIGRFMLDNRHAGIFADPGLGKTSASLMAWQALQRLGLAQRCLIIAPLRVATSTWPQEIADWDQFGGIDYAIVCGSERQRLKALKRNASLTIINAENVPWLLTTIGKNHSFDTLIVDESTKFKNYGAKRFKALRQLLARFSRRYILTGTPSPNGVADLYAQIFILDLGAALGKNVTAFRREYFFKGGYQGREWIPYERSAAAIQEAIKHLVIRLDREDHLDMPPILFNNVWLDMPAAFRSEYKTLEQKLFLQLDDGDLLTPGTAGATYGLCRQLANGGIYLSDEVVDGSGTIKRVRVGVEHRHNIKTAAARDLVDELQGKPTMIVFQYDHDHERLVKEFGDCPTIKGGTSAQQSRKIVDDWNAGKIPVLLCQPAAMSHGLNMQRGGNDIVWYGLTDNQEVYQQTNERIYRSGVVGQVRIHHLLLRSTIDEAVLLNLQTKTADQKSLLDALNTYRKGLS